MSSNKQTQKINGILQYIIPIIIVIIFISAIFISPLFNFDIMAQSWFYVAAAIVSLVLTMFAKIPSFLKIRKSHNTKSFATATLFFELSSGSINALTIVGNQVFTILYKDTNIVITLARWIPSLLSVVISLSVTGFILYLKIKNKFKNKKSEKVIYHSKNGKTYFVILFALILVIMTLAIIVYFCILPNANYSKMSGFEWGLFILSNSYVCIVIFSSYPLIVKILRSHNTSSLGIVTTLAAILGCTVSIVLDIMTIRLNTLTSWIPVLVAHSFSALSTIFIFSFKLINIARARRIGISEKEYCEVFFIIVFHMHHKYKNTKVNITHRYVYDKIKNMDKETLEGLKHMDKVNFEEEINFFEVQN